MVLYDQNIAALKIKSNWPRRFPIWAQMAYDDEVIITLYDVQENASYRPRYSQYDRIYKGGDVCMESLNDRCSDEILHAGEQPEKIMEQEYDGMEIVENIL